MPKPKTTVQEFREYSPESAALLNCEERVIDAEERAVRIRELTCDQIEAVIGVLLDREDKHSRLRDSINRAIKRIREDHRDATAKQ